MSRAVRFDHYGGADVLAVADVERPEPGPGQVLVAVKAAGINLGESKVREGLFQDRWPTTFPSGQGSDLAGIVEELGEGVGRIAVGDEVIGFTENRASHAELVLVEQDNLVPRPPSLPWEQAGALFVTGTTAYAVIRAVALGEGDTVVISAAAGGVGTIAVQLARLRGARVIGLASEPHHEWLTEHGVIPVTYGDGAAERIRRAAGREPIDAFIDGYGDGYVELALELGVRPERIDTIVDIAAVQRHGVKFEGHAVAANADVLGEVARLAGAGRLEIPIANSYGLDDVQAAFCELERSHSLGKIVLEP
jgi:NADPH:quinone reductase-like Zn-dependent oxidoreductase